jgi:hypothetical protein
MIKVIFAPGCYGTFLSKCLYYLTDIAGVSANTDWKFDALGSSHDLRIIPDAKKYILHGHPIINGGDTISYDKSDTIISIVPCENNRLDYYDNQFYKQQKERIVSYIWSHFPKDVIHKKLQDGWNYNGRLDTSTPRWILREWCSFWLTECLHKGYDQSFFLDLPAVVHVTTQDFFSDLPKTLQKIATAVGVNVSIDHNQIITIQEKFVNAQKIHGIQDRCSSWIDDVLHGRSSTSPCMTLFDEAWIQYQLRTRGYEIRCDGLEQWPDHSQIMGDLLYQIS